MQQVGLVGAARAVADQAAPERLQRLHHGGDGVGRRVLLKARHQLVHGWRRRTAERGRHGHALRGAAGRVLDGVGHLPAQQIVGGPDRPQLRRRHHQPERARAEEIHQRLPVVGADIRGDVGDDDVGVQIEDLPQQTQLPIGGGPHRRSSRIRRDEE